MTTVANRDAPRVFTNFDARDTDDKTQAEGLSSLIRKVTCAAWAIEKLISWRIWTTYRLLPTLPLFNFLANVPAICHTLLFGLSMLLILGLMFKNNRYLMGLLLAVEVIQCALDQNRIQPWEYQFFFIALLFIFYPNNRRAFVASVAFVLVSTYFYSGVNKINEGFLQSVWNNLILGQFLHLPFPLRHQGWLYYGGYLVGLIESALGIGLLFKRTQKRSAILLILMHLSILVIWGPFGLRGYRILWFWNASMTALLYLVFIRGKVEILPALSNAWKKPVFIFWGLLPALSFVGLWPKNLSSNMFSGNAPWMVICIQDFGHHGQLRRFSTFYDPSCTCRGTPAIYLQTWIFWETTVSINPESRLMLEMQQRLVQQYPDCKFTFFINRR